MNRRDVDVAQGGLFHTRNVSYNQETARFLKELIKESKLSIAHRRMINDSLKNGEPLPLPRVVSKSAPKSAPSGSRRKMASIPIRRKKEQIVQSGAYNREDTMARSRPVDYEREKRRLQDLMAFGKTLKGRVGKSSISSRESSCNESICSSRDETAEEIGKILEEIDNRERFLAEMKALGRGKNYEEMIRQEIAAKYRKLEKIDGDLSAAMKSDYSRMQESKAAANAIFQY